MAMLKVCDIQSTVPTGTYNARLLGYKEMPASQRFPDSGTSYVWEFSVSEGIHSGKTCSRWTPTKLTTGNNFGKLIRELRGKPIIGGEDIDPDVFINKVYTITVGPGAEEGKTKVIMCAPLVTSTMAPPPPPPAPVANRRTAPVAPPAPLAPPAPVAPVQTIDTKDKTIFVSRDGVEKAKFMDYDEAYAMVNDPTWAGAMVYDTKAKVYVPARDYLLPF